LVVELHQWTAAIYLASGLVAGLSLALPAPGLFRVALGLLAGGALLHAVSFSFLHSAVPPPPLTDLPAAVSFMALVGTLFFLALLWRVRLAPLLVFVAPVAFVGVFFAALRLPAAGPATTEGSGSWPHAHVLLASAGLAALGVAGLAGALYLVEHRRLKSRRAPIRRVPVPSLEALDRVNVAALAVGFPLLTLGVVTGMLWVQSVSGRVLSGAPHETFSLCAWAIYVFLVAARFLGRQPARRAAASAVAGFAFLFVAVIGIELLRLGA
jgi:ABC-type transport system involved in cytochrome c biogenesis permease subunit